MLDLVLYYKDVEALCLDIGEWVRIHSLYDDIKNGTPPSPKSIRLLAEKYDGDIERMKHNHDRIAKNALLDWNPLRELLKAHGEYDVASAKTFLDRMQIRGNDCDFRAMVRTWARAELQKIEDGKEAKFYSPRDFLDRYEKLLIDRKKREEKKNRRY